jgi:hypothetical protein
MMGALARRADIVAQFPFLRSVQAAKTRGCGRCGRRRVVEDASKKMNAAKRAIADLPADKKELLKRLIHASDVTMYLRVEGGVKRVTF